LPTNDGINIIGTPYGSPEFVEEYLQRKLAKHEQLLDFISDVAKMGFSRETHKMLTGFAVPRFTHIAKSVKDDASSGWMSAVDDAHLSTWLECTGVSTLDADLSSQERHLLTASLDLPPQFGGIGLQSLIRAADEELLGSLASVTANLIVFLRTKSLSVYDKLVDALDAMADDDTDVTNPPVIPTIASIMAVSARAHTFLADITQSEMDFATSLTLGERLVEVPGRFVNLETHTKPEPIVLPDLRVPADYVTAPCKHECAIMKQARHVRQAYQVWTDNIVTQRALMLSRSRQCGLDTASASLAEVEAVATMDRPEKYTHLDIGESILASTLHIHGLPFDYASLQLVDPPYACPICCAPLTDPLWRDPLHKQLYS
jgi:hypothetical protein